MAEENNNVLEQRIINVIEIIRKGRSKPCYQRILEQLNRGSENILEMEKLKQSCNDMIRKKLISKKGKKNKESFYIQNKTDDENTSDESLLQKDIQADEHIINSSNSEIEEGKINEEFYVTLTTMIEREVKKVFESKYENESRTSNKKRECNEMDNYKSLNKMLIDSLNSEIIFLRNELSAKDKIIEMVIKGHDSCYNRNTQQKTKDNKNNVHQPSSNLGKNRERINENEENEEIVLTNRFSALMDKEPLSNEYTEQINNNVKKNKVTTIVGDSIIKEIKSHRMKVDLDPNDRIYIKSFPGATIECMKDYVKPALRHNPDLIIVHAGTNDLRSEQTSKEIAENILNLVNDIKTDTNEVKVSGITLRRDKYNEKGLEVNILLKSLCSENRVGYIDNSAITNKHLNGSGIHLNYNGTSLLAMNFIKEIKP